MKIDFRYGILNKHAAGADSVPPRYLVHESRVLLRG